MSSEIKTMSDLQRGVLHHLMAGWQTMDEAKEAGFVRLTELADHFGMPPEELRQELALLEAWGYVDNVHSLGMDQTQQYKGFEQTTPLAENPDNPTYFITENGKRLVIADTSSDTGDAASPS